MNRAIRTFVLVHGGWHGGWCWSLVARILRKAGHAVFTPTLTGLGERAHLLSADITLQTGIDDIRGVLEAEELKRVVLVGHSAGAPVVLGVADQMREPISSLIFLDGVLLQDGESLRTHFTPLQEEAYQTSLLLGKLPFAPPPASVFDIPEGPEADWVDRRLTAQPFGTASSALRLQNPLGNDLACAYVAFTSPVHPFVEASHRFAREQESWQWREIVSGHDAIISASEEVASVLQDLAEFL